MACIADSGPCHCVHGACPLVRALGLATLARRHLAEAVELLSVDPLAAREALGDHEAVARALTDLVAEHGGWFAARRRA
jgi:hypothetical protein